MTKQFTTTQPETARAAYHAPETFTLKRAKSSALAFVAVLLLALAAWLGFAQGWTVPAVVVLVLAAYAGVNAFWLSSLTERLIANELPRQPRHIKPTSTAPIYFTRRMNVAGDPVEVDEHPIDLGNMKAGEVKRALEYLRRGGKPTRDAMRKSIDISQGQWSKLMDWLEDEGMAAPLPNGSVKIVGDLSAAIDDLTAQLDRW